MLFWQKPLQAKAVIETLKQAVIYAHRMRQWDEGMAAAELLVEWERDFATFNVCRHSRVIHSTPA
jgi:hypothetical protein